MKIKKLSYDRYMNCLNERIGAMADFIVIEYVDFSVMRRLIAEARNTEKPYSVAAAIAWCYSKALKESKVWSNICGVENQPVNNVRVAITVNAPDVSLLWVTTVLLENPHLLGIVELSKRMKHEAALARKGQTPVHKVLARWFKFVKPELLARLVALLANTSESFWFRHFSTPVLTVVRKVELGFPVRLSFNPLALSVGEIDLDGQHDFGDRRIPLALAARHRFASGSDAADLLHRIKTNLEHIDELSRTSITLSSEKANYI